MKFRLLPVKTFHSCRSLSLSSNEWMISFDCHRMAQIQQSNRLLSCWCSAPGPSAFVSFHWVIKTRLLASCEERISSTGVEAPQRIIAAQPTTLPLSLLSQLICTPNEIPLLPDWHSQIVAGYTLIALNSSTRSCLFVECCINTKHYSLSHCVETTLWQEHFQIIKSGCYECPIRI